MPRKLDIEPDDDNEDEEQEEHESQPSPPRVRGGWRSDDSMFYGPKSQVRGLDSGRLAGMTRNISAPPSRELPVFDESSDYEDVLITASVPDYQQSSMGAGMRGFLRRASEHLPGFIRPTIGPNSSDGLQRSPDSSPRLEPSPLSAPLPSRPVLDETPAMARSAFPIEGEFAGGLAHRLEKALSSQPLEGVLSGGAGVSRAKSLGSKVTFGAEPKGGKRAAQAHRASIAGFAHTGKLAGKTPDRDESQAKSQAVACAGRKREDEDGW